MTQSPETRLSLLARLSDRVDGQAWAEFVEIYEPLIYRLARRKGLQDADAREVTQDVLLAVAGAIDGWEPTAGKGSFRAWLFRIARNLVINLRVKQSRHPRGTGDTEVLRWLEEQPAPSADVSQLVEEEYRRQIFRAAAERIRTAFKRKTWQAFWRTCVDGEPIRTVASELQMTAGAVYVARSRVIARLSQEISEFGLSDAKGINHG